MGPWTAPARDLSFRGASPMLAGSHFLQTHDTTAAGGDAVNSTSLRCIEFQCNITATRTY